MRGLAEQKKFIIAAAAIMPSVFLFGIWRSIRTLESSFNSVMIYCIKKIEILFSYFSHPENVLLVVLSSLLLIGFIKGMVFFIYQLYYSHKLKNEFEGKLVKNNLQCIHGVDVLIVNDKRLFALTVGFLNPVIYISSELIKQLGKQELKSVVHHEHYHQAKCHPLIKLIIGTSKSFLFFVPVMPTITKQITLRQEALADRESIEKTSRKSLVSAFLKISKSFNGLAKVSTSISQFSLTRDRFLLVVNRNQVPSIKLPLFLSSLSLIIVSLFAYSLFYTPYAHAQISNSVNLVENYEGVCHGLSQSLLSIVSGEQSKLNITAIVK